MHETKKVSSLPLALLPIIEEPLDESPKQADELRPLPKEHELNKAKDNRNADWKINRFITFYLLLT